LFKTENEEKNGNTINKKQGTYELKLDLFNEVKESNNNKNSIKMRELEKKKFKFIYAGINQLIEIIKIIKRTENQNMFYNTKQSETVELSKNFDNFNTSSYEDKKIIVQSLYKDIFSSDNYINYIIDRIREAKSFKLMNNFIKKIIYPQYEMLPSYIKPVYFEKIIVSIYQNIIRISLGKMPSYILNFGDFAIGLSLSRYEFISKNIFSSFNNKLIKKYEINQKYNIYQNMCDLHISSGLSINENNNKISLRDILISFNSLFLIPKLFNQAKIILKLIGSTMKNGLIPDKIDKLNNFKYNSRDICWYYIKAIKDYIYTTLDYKFLKEEIYLLHLPENVINNYFKQKNKKNKKIFTVENILQFIFQYHAQGINFIDKKIEQQPYQRRPVFKKNKEISSINRLKINVWLDKETGFIYGGNKYNAGTWMDHIGTSTKAKNINIPATPRDGADIEIIALLYNCLNFVNEINYKNYYSYNSVILNNNEVYSFYQWSLAIKKNFEKKFFLRKVHPTFQNKLNIYKDYIIKPNNNENNVKVNEEIEKENDNKEIEEEKEEYKLRPNVLLAIYYAPDLFLYENVLKVLENIEKYLLRSEIINENINGLIGIKTLDKTDTDFIGKIDFKDTNNYKSSCGFNLHNGVEFTWLYGIYLMIKIKYKFNFNYDNIENDTKDSFIPRQTDEMVRYVSKKLIPFIKYMKGNKYMGVPEIIDEIGNVSNEGYQSSLKSMATFFELINKLAWVNDKVNNNNFTEDEMSSLDEYE
jgi:glycogen debranching enzyme